MIRRKLSNLLIKKDPNLVWNSFIDLLAMEDENDLTRKQKIAQQIFLYESEVQNGGHLQFFENYLSLDFYKLVESLKFVGANNFVGVLEDALNIFSGKERKHFETVQEYSDGAMLGEFNEVDLKYYELKPDINHYLEKYLEKNFDEFIELTD